VSHQVGYPSRMADTSRVGTKF